MDTWRWGEAMVGGRVSAPTVVRLALRRLSLLLVALSACAEHEPSTRRLALTLEGRHSYSMEGPARDVIVVDGRVIAIEGESNQIVWFDSWGKEIVRTEDLFLGVAEVDGEVYAYHRQAVYRVPSPGQIEFCHSVRAEETIHDLLAGATGKWVVTEANGLKMLKPLSCGLPLPPTDSIPLPPDLVLSGNDQGMVGVTARRPFRVWSISRSGAEPIGDALTSQSDRLAYEDFFLQGVVPLDRGAFLALFTDLRSSDRHAVVLDVGGTLISESNLGAPVGLAGSRPGAFQVYFNVSRPTGGEVLAYRWQWRESASTGGEE